LSRTWEQAQDQMRLAYETLMADGFQPDGIKVECGPIWSRRQSRQVG
jgi:hypothetical protein